MDFVTKLTVGGGLSNEDRNAIIDRLCNHYHFNLERLLEWLESIRASAFWQPDNDHKLDYPRALQMYSTGIFRAETGTNYEDFLEMVAIAFYEKRSQTGRADDYSCGVRFHPVMDGALMLLDSEIEQLGVIYQLLNSPLASKVTDKATLDIVTGIFKSEPFPYAVADWAMNNWLPRNFRILIADYVAKEAEAKAKAEAAKQAARKGGATEFRDVAP